MGNDFLIEQRRNNQYHTIPDSNKITGYILYWYKAMSSYVHPFSISPSTMVALEGDGASLQPPHPTMPSYSLRETHQTSGVLKFPFKRPRIPIEWTTHPHGTKSSVESLPSVPLTMEIRMTASQDTILFTAPTLTPTPILQPNYTATLTICQGWSILMWILDARIELPAHSIVIHGHSSCRYKCNATTWQYRQPQWPAEATTCWHAVELY